MARRAVADVLAGDVGVPLVLSCAALRGEVNRLGGRVAIRSALGLPALPQVMWITRRGSGDLAADRGLLRCTTVLSGGRVELALSFELPRQLSRECSCLHFCRIDLRFGVLHRL